MKRIKNIFILFVGSSYFLNGQITNYVSNGSFEKTFACAVSDALLKNVICWNSLDSSNNVVGGGYFNSCNSGACCGVPINSASYQYAKNGQGYLLGQFFCTQCAGVAPERGYFKNRLKNKLESGKTYCSKMYVNNAERCKYAIDGLAMYYGGVELDTISIPNDALPWIHPQVESNILINDTMNWVAVSNTFVATGNEKYLVIGCFKSNASVNYLIKDNAYGPWAGYNVDDVSCIEVDLAAYAGRDTSIALGDSVFIGREPDFAVDSGCTWYQLPNLSTPIKKISGFWVKPTATSTYVVRQILDCSAEKWDTVSIKLDINAVGVQKNKWLSEQLKIYPVPAKDFLQLQTSSSDLIKHFDRVSIYNNLGMLVREEEIHFENSKSTLKTSDLPNGIYSLQLKSHKLGTVSKRFVIAK